MSKSRTLGLSFGLFTAMLVSIGQAEAHAVLVTGDPAPDSSVAAPAKITLHFNEALAGRFSKFKVARANGKAVALKVAAAEDAKSLAAIPTAALTPGQYKVSWTAVSGDDGHKMQGNYKFTVK
jgi:methionine-rich copper-binding protein CopC